MAEAVRKGKNKSGKDYSLRIIIAEATITKDGQVHELDTQPLVDMLADTMEAAVVKPKGRPRKAREEEE